MLKLLHIYPSLCNLYGDYANLTWLSRELGLMGAECEIERAELGEPIDVSGADFIYMGPATETRLKYALEGLRKCSAELLSAKKRGVQMLFTGNAAECCGKSLSLPGEKLTGLGLCRFTAVRTAERQTGDVIYSSKLSESPAVGFINKSGWLQNVEEPLFTAEFGPGGILSPNGEQLPKEGIAEDGLIATYVTGPVLVKNPWLRRLVAAKIASRAGFTPAPAAEDDTDRAYAVTLSELEKRKK